MSRIKTVTIGNSSICNSIFKYKIVIALLLLPFFKNSFYGYIGNLALIFNIFIFIEAIIFCVLFLFERVTNRYVKFIFIFLIWTYFVSPFAHGHTAPSMYYFYEAIGVISIFELGFKYNADNTIEASSSLFAIMTVLNYATLYVFPGGLGTADGTAMYLFGIRTGFSLYIIPGILLNLIRDVRNETIISLRTIVIILFGTAALFNQSVATGLLQLSVIGSLYLLLHNPKIAKKLNIYIFTLVFFVLDFLITIFGTKFNLLGYVASLFGKDPTFSNRTFIWANAVSKISQSPIFGFGADNMVSGGTHMLQAHNQWLNIAIEGGYISLALFLMGIFASMYALYKAKNYRWYRPVAICISAMLIGSISEIQTYVPFIYFVFDLPFLLEEKRWSD